MKIAPGGGGDGGRVIGAAVAGAGWGAAATEGATAGGCTGGVVHATTSNDNSASAWRWRPAMEWLFIEALAALLLGLGIVWWTTGGLRKRRPKGEPEDTDGADGRR